MSALKIKIIIALLCLSLVQGCGFRLAGKADLDPVFDNTYVTFSGRGRPMAELLEAQFKTNQVNLVAQDQATAVVSVLYENRTREILSVDEEGRVNEYELVLRVGISVANAEGQQLIPNQDLRLSRDFFFEIDEVLGNEEQTIYQELREDISRLIIYRLQAISTVAAEA